MAYQAMQKSWFKMPAYSAVYNPAKKDIEAGDKIILNTGILQALMQRFGERPLPHPLVFEIQNVTDRRISHCGVLEFSAEQSTAFLPAWMMLNMGLSEGQEVQLKLKELPLATSLVLQPLKYTFAQIPTPKIALEHALASFTALTAGDTISITVHGRSHSLSVVDVKPDTRMVGQKNACCVVNAHLEVDFLPPLEQEPESAQALLLSLGEVRAGEECAAGSYRYYRVKTLDSGLAFQVEVTARSGDPELVVSTSTNKPALTDCTWKSISSLGTTSASRAASAHTRTITVAPNSVGFVVGWYYVGVLAYGTDATFDVVMREVVPPETEAARAPAGPAVGSLSASDPNARKCDNCQQFISQKAHSLHSAQCARLNTYCGPCGKPIRKSDLPSHAHCPTCNLVLHPADMCFTTGTRLLTEGGFLSLAQIETLSQAERERLRYACYDVALQALVYRTGKIVYPKGGAVFDLTNRSSRLSIRVTGNHELYVQLGRRDSKSDDDALPPFKVTVDKLLALERANPGRTIRFAAVAVNGHLPSQADAAVAADSSASAPASLAASLAPSVALAADGGRDATDWATALTPAMKSLDKGQVRLVLEELRRASGSSLTDVGGDEKVILTDDVSFRDQLVHACLHAGYAAYFESAHEHNNLPTPGAIPAASDESLHAAAPLWRVVYTEPTSASASDEDSACWPSLDLADVREVKYDGRFWCVTVDHPDHLVVVQRVEEGGDEVEEEGEDGGVVRAASRPVIIGQSKHIDLVHKCAPCPECNEPVDPALMQLHRREECKMRPAQCQYCHMEMAHRLVFEHQQICGAQTIPCERCQKPVSRKRMDIHYAVDHGVNLSLRPGDRSSMGSSAPRVTAQYVAQQHKQMAGFQAVKDPAEAAAPTAPLSEDEEMARAIAQSLADEESAFAASAAAAGSSSYAASAASSQSAAHSGMASAAVASPDESSDLALQQALLESRLASNGSGNGVAALSAGVSAPEPLRSPPSGVFDGDARDDDWGADDDGGAAMEDDAVHTWSDDDGDDHASAAAPPATKAPRKAELDCPYCAAEHQTDAQLEKHMAECAAVDD